MKAFLIVSALIISTTALFGQDLEAIKYKQRPDSSRVKKYSAMGIHAGFNNCLNKDAGGKLIYSPGFLFDVYEVFDLNKKWSIQGGLGGIMYGAKNLGYGNKNQRHDTLFYFNNTFSGAFYITVPLVVKYRCTDQSTFIAGLRLCSIIDTYGNSVDGYEVNHIKTEYQQLLSPDDFPPHTNKRDIGPILGYEYHFNKRLSISAIINIGLVPIFTTPYIDQNGLPYPIGAGNYNNSLSIGINYDFLKN
jgi:hypothetical protein